MQRVYRLIHKVSHASFPVLILGESGTGKELVARALHGLSTRSKNPFVPVDCAALVSALMEVELFGHVKGAFTDAHSSRVGLLGAATKGTVFLDEIGEMQLHLQAKLLRAIQEREIRPVGGTERIGIDVRIVAATNRNLEAEVRESRFREDLYFRLNVVVIKLPPLRERKVDIPLLVELFREKFGGLRMSPASFSEEAMARLMAYNWPGNVRELENAVEHAMALGTGQIIGVEDLPPAVAAARDNEDGVLRFELRNIERRAIIGAIRSANGDKKAAARLLGIGKTTLYRKLNQYRSTV